MKKQSGWTSYLFLLPALGLYILSVVYPTIRSVYLSFFDWNGILPKTYIGVKNYVSLLTNDKIFWIALKNNVLWIVLTVCFTVTVSLILALALNREFRGRTFYRAIFYVPYMFSWIVVGIIWKWMYNPNMGFINEFLRLIGLDNLTRNWLAEKNIAIYCIYVAALWQGVGQPMVYFISGLSAIPEDILEAARIDGAGKFSMFFNITLPMLKETFVVVLATLIIASMKVYDIVYTMTGGGPANATQTLASYMYSQTFKYNKLGKGSAIASIMLVIMLFVIVPYVIFTSRDTTAGKEKIK